MSGATKNDSGKTCRPGLIAPEMTIGIGKVLAFGARKYSAGNWALGMDWSRPIDALDRHWTAWKSGEKCDPETGYSHLWHMGCCLMFLIAYEARRIGRDDRVECGLMCAPSREIIAHDPDGTTTSRVSGESRDARAHRRAATRDARPATVS